MTTPTSIVPSEFADLSALVADWALPSSAARLRRRLDSSAEQRQEFYHAMCPRADAALQFLNGFPLPEIQQRPDLRNLMSLLLALAEVSLSEEVNGQTVETVHAEGNRKMYVVKELDAF